MDAPGPGATLGDAVAQLDASLPAVGPGASVGLLTRNRPAHYAALIAIIATGRCVVTLTPMLGEQQVAADVAALGLHAVLGSAHDLARPPIQAAAEGSAVLKLDDEGSPLTLVDRYR